MIDCDAGVKFEPTKKANLKGLAFFMTANGGREE